MKQMLRKKDVWVLLAALIGAFACVTLIQFISGRIDGVASMVFLLAEFFVSMYTDGYWWGVAGSVISVLAVNFAFRTPYFAFNFTIPENIFSGVVMLVVSFMTSTLTTRIKKQEQLRMESETEKMRANLLRAVSHDLRTPLTRMRGLAEVTVEGPPELGRYRELAGVVADECSQMIQIINTMLEITKTESNIETPEAELLDLREMIARAAELFQPLDGDVRLAAELPDAAVPFRGDRIKLQRVVSNLIDNALKFTPPGGTWNAIGRWDAAAVWRWKLTTATLRRRSAPNSSGGWANRCRWSGMCITRSTSAENRSGRASGS